MVRFTKRARRFVASLSVSRGTAALGVLSVAVVSAMAATDSGDVLGRLLIVQSGSSCVTGCQSMSCSGSETGETKSWCDAKAAGTCEAKCSSMGGSGGSGGSYSGGSYYGSMTVDQCKAGCDSMTSGDKDACKRGCDSMGSGGSYTNTSGATSTTGGGTTTSTTTTTGTSPAGSTDPMYWYNKCLENGTPEGCAFMKPAAPATTTGTTGATSGSCGTEPSWPDCATKSCSNGNWTCTQMKTGTTGTTTGGSGVEWCFYKATRNGVELGYSVDCPKGDTSGCYKESHSMAGATRESAAGLTLGTTSSCYKDGGSGGWSGTTGTTGGSWTPQYWSQAKQKTFQLPDGKSSCDKLVNESEIPASEKDWCYMATGSSGGGGTGNGSTGGAWNTSSMKNCQYPQARILKSGSETGMSVWCAGDYVDCHEGGPDGPAITRDNIRSLGAPGACDSGWTGGSSGQGMSCEDGCRKMPQMQQTDPMCQGTNKQTWCTQSVDQCIASCKGTYAGNNTTVGRQGSCPAGKVECYPPCKMGGPCAQGFSCVDPGMCNKGESTGATGDTGGTGKKYPDMISCVQAECPKDTSTPAYATCKNTCVGKIGTTGGMTGGDPIGDRMCIIDPCKGDPRCMAAVWTVRCDSKECAENPNCGPQSGGGRGGVPVSGDECFKKYCSALDSSTNEYAKCKSGCFNQGGSQGGSQNPECMCSELHPKGSVAYNQCRNRCFGPSVPGTDGSEWPNPKVMLPEYNAKDECARIREKMGMLGDIPSVKAMLDQLLRQCDKGGKPTAGAGLEIRDQAEQIHQEAYAANSCDAAKRGAEEARTAITKYAPQAIKKVKNAATVGKLNAILDSAKSLLVRIDAVLSKDCDEALTLVDEMEKFGDAFEEAMPKGSAGIEIVNHDDDYEELYESFEEEVGDDEEEGEETSFEDFAATMEKRGYKSTDLALLKTLDPKLVKEYVQYAGRSDSGRNDAVKVVANAGVSVVVAEDILKANNELQKEIAELKESVKNLKAGPAKFLGMIQDRVFNPAVGDVVKDLIERSPDLTENQLRAEFDKVVAASREADFDQGYIPFRDIDLNDGGWYLQSVQKLTEGENPLFRGTDEKKETFDPNGTANIAQVVTVVARALDLEGDGSSPVSALARNAPEWAKSAAVGLEEEGVDLKEVFEDGKPGDAAERIEVARLVTEAFGDSLATPDEDEIEDIVSDYEDLTGLPAEDQEAAATCIFNEIMTGTDGKFDPDGAFNRAQFATVMDRVLSQTSVEEPVSNDEDHAAAPAGPAGVTDDAATQEQSADEEKREEAASIDFSFLEKLDLQQANDLLVKVQYHNSLQKGPDYMTKGAADRKLIKEMQMWIEAKWGAVKGSTIGIYGDATAALSDHALEALKTALKDLDALQHAAQ